MRLWKAIWRRVTMAKIPTINTRFIKKVGQLPPEQFDVFKRLADEAMADKYRPGNIIQGRVTSFVDTPHNRGALIEFEPGVLGLLKLAEISWEKPKAVSDVLSIGQNVEVVVFKKRRDGLIMVGMKQLVPQPERPPEPTPRKVICNKCGESCAKRTSTLGHFNNEGLIREIVGGGYGSDVLGDLNLYRFSVCEKCLWEYFSTFKIPPEFAHDPMNNMIPIEWKRFKTFEQLKKVWCGDSDTHNRKVLEWKKKRSKCSNPRARKNYHGRSVTLRDDGTFCTYCDKPLRESEYFTK